MNRRSAPKKLSTQFIKLYSFILIAVVLVISVTAIISLSTYFIYQEKQFIQMIEREFEKASQDEDINWQETLNEVVYPKYPNHAFKVKESNGSEYYSPTSDDLEIEDDEKLIKLPILSTVYVYDDDLFYADTFSVSGEAEVTIVFSLEALSEFIVSIAFILFLVALFAIGFGVVLIYFTTRNHIRPILDLTETVSNMNYREKLGVEIEVPSEPVEIANLGTSFNKLLTELEGYVENEKSFVSNASHELRSPVSAIIGNANLIKRRGQSNPEVIEPAIEAIAQESYRMEKMINQLLEIARNENYNAEMVSLNISKVTKEVCEEFYRDGDCFTLNCDIEPNLYTIGNHLQIRQVLIILLDNAKKYIRSDGIITVSLFQNGKSIILQVSDNGVGIEKSEHNKIFKRFYRVDQSRARSTGGAGLGLSLAEQLINLHDGKIELESEPGVGSTFRIILSVVNE